MNLSFSALLMNKYFSHEISVASVSMNKVTVKAKRKHGNVSENISMKTYPHLQLAVFTSCDKTLSLVNVSWVGVPF